MAINLKLAKRLPVFCVALFVGIATFTQMAEAAFKCTPLGGHMRPSFSAAQGAVWWLNFTDPATESGGLAIKTFVATSSEYVERNHRGAAEFRRQYFEGRDRTFSQGLIAANTPQLCDWLRTYCEPSAKLRNDYNFCY